MEERIVRFKSPIDPITKEDMSPELFSYRGKLLHWGVRSEVIDKFEIVSTNTVAIIEALDISSEGTYPVLVFLPEEIEFE